jgi:hypothetical protein
MKYCDSVILPIKHNNKNTRYFTSKYGTSNNCRAKIIIPNVSFLKIIVMIHLLTLKVGSLSITQN